MLSNLSRSFEIVRKICSNFDESGSTPPFLFIFGTRSRVSFDPSCKRLVERTNTRVGEGSRDTEASTRSCVVEESRFLKRDKNFGNMETRDAISGWIRSRNSSEQIVRTVIRGRIDRIFREMTEEIFQGEKRIFERFQCFSFSFFFLSPTKRNSEVKKSLGR